VLKVGLTGGIGSGKTTVAGMFEALGIPVFYSDTEARKLQETDKELIAETQELLGAECYLPNGQLNRKYIASRVFADSDLLGRLNALVHPKVARSFKIFCSAVKAPFCIKEAAILFESGASKELDKVIAITAPEAERIQRVIKRDKTDEQEVKRRLANQWTDEQRVSGAHFVIDNRNGAILLPQVLEIYHTLVADK
jgi:dephospho-CoA kinase